MAHDQTFGDKHGAQKERFVLARRRLNKLAMVVPAHVCSPTAHWRSGQSHSRWACDCPDKVWEKFLESGLDSMAGSCFFFTAAKQFVARNRMETEMRMRKITVGV